MKCIVATLSLIVGASADASIERVLADLKSEFAALKDEHQSTVTSLEENFKALKDEHRALKHENRVLKDEITLLGESRNNEAPQRSLRRKFGKSGKSGKSAETSFCYADDGMTVDLFAYAEVDDGTEDDTTVGTVEYGIVDVKDGETIVVDATVSSDAYVSTVTDDGYGDTDTDLYMSVKLYEGCTKTPCGSGKLVTPTPSNRIPLHALFNFFAVDDGVSAVNEISSEVTSNGKFYFPDLDEGPHLLEVVFDIEVGIINSDAFSAAEMEIDTFVIQVDRMDAESMQCDLDVETGLRLL